MSADEASIATATGLENHLQYRNSIENEPVTADDEDQNGHADVADIMGTAETDETAETDRLETNETETAETEPTKAEESDENQATTESAEEPHEIDDNTADHNERVSNPGTKEAGSDQVGAGTPQITSEKHFNSDCHNTFILFDLIC